MRESHYLVSPAACDLCSLHSFACLESYKRNHPPARGLFYRGGLWKLLFIISFFLFHHVIQTRFALISLMPLRGLYRSPVPFLYCEYFYCQKRSVSERITSVYAVFGSFPTRSGKTSRNDVFLRISTRSILYCVERRKNTLKVATNGVFPRIFTRSGVYCVERRI